MILNQKSRFLAVNLVAFFIAVAFSGSVHAAECPQMPEVAWWEKVTHASTIDYVKRNHAGDWSLYILKWENQVEKLEEIFSRDGAVVVTKDKIKLDGDMLRDYIENVRSRVVVIRCLSKL